MTNREKIEYLDEEIRPIIQRHMISRMSFFFCSHTLGERVPLCYDNFEDFRIIEAMKLCGGWVEDKKDYPFNSPKNHSQYTEWKMEILDKAIELLGND